MRISKFERTSTIVFLLLTLALFSEGCGVSSHMENMDQNTNRMASELETDRNDIKALNENTTRMATQLEAYQNYIKTLTESFQMLAENFAALRQMSESVLGLFLGKVKDAPPAPTPDIDDVLNGPKNPQKPDSTRHAPAARSSIKDSTP